jgi:DNA-directed RNA polymerase specialized sigma24 family protein
MAKIDADASVTQWISELKEGEASAAEGLWEHYFHRLVGLARSKLTAAPRRAADEEDVALSAFKSLCLGAADGRFPHLRDRDNLWPLLVVLTVRKARDLVKHERRKKRGGDVERPGSPAIDRDEWNSIVGAEPTPEFSAMVTENFERLLGMLDTKQRQIALLKLEGYSSAEVAEQLDCGLRMVERRLELIRRIWQEAGEAASFSSAAESQAALGAGGDH